MAGTAQQHDRLDQALRDSATSAYGQYERMLGDGIAKEVARTCLPVSINSTA